MANPIYGTDSNNWLGGNDTLNDTIYGYAGDDRLYGYAGSDKLDGGDGNDSLKGGTGADSMLGGIGDDTYEVDNIGDIVVEKGSSGNDWVSSTINYTLGAFVENLNLDVSGSSAVRGTGNGLDNIVYGNSFANILDGKAGDDELQGGVGADTIYGGDGNDSIYGNRSGYNGSDAGNKLYGQAGDDYIAGHDGADTIDGGTENDVAYGGYGTDSILGGTGDDSLYGEADRDTLRGNDGNDSLDGGGNELDYLDGGLGNDTYYLAQNNDSIADAGGVDTVQVGFSLEYLVPDSIENVVALDSYGVKVVGNLNANIMTAAGSNSRATLEGGDGNDRVTGGNGSDYLKGDAGNDVIDARDAANYGDTLVGGAGNDIFYIDGRVVSGSLYTDTVTEVAGEGNDLVSSSVNYTLAANVERLVISGTAKTGTGNELANSISGNAVANILYGGAGNDALNGGAGNDTLFGGLNDKTAVGGIDTLTGAVGNDVFALANKYIRFYDDGLTANAGRGGYALITDFTVGQDKLQLGGLAAEYTLGASGVAGVAGTGLWHEQGATDELVAIIQSGNTTALTAANTIATGLFV